MNYVAVHCRACNVRLSEALLVLEQEAWEQWTMSILEGRPYADYCAVPLVPFGAVVRFKSPTPLKWGENALLEEGAFGGVKRKNSLFFAPYGLSLQLGQFVTECCGPSAYGPDVSENLFCRCGAAIGWLEETCFRHVNFTRVLARHVKLKEEEYRWPPVLSDADFDEELLQIVSSSVVSGAQGVWRFWNILQNLNTGTAAQSWPYFWTSVDSDQPGRTVRIFEGRLPDDMKTTITAPLVRTIEISAFAQHVRLAASLALRSA